MGLYQRENGIYYLQIKENKSYKRLSLGTKNYVLAQNMYDSYLLSQIKDKFSSQKSSQEITSNKAHQKTNLDTNKRHSIEKSYIEYIELCKSQNLSKDVLYSKARLRTYLKSVKINYIEDIKQETINKLVNTHQKETANKHLRNLKAYLNFCIKKRYFKRDDYEALTFLMTKHNVRDIVIDEQDYLKLLENCQDDDFKLYMMSLWETGCRPNEIVPLKKSDIDFDKGIVKVFQTKTKKYKTVYLTDTLLKLYKEKSSERLFNAYDKNKTHYGRIFKKLRDDLDMNKEYCLYAFRHSFGTRMLNKTKDIHLVSKLLGHSDISITAKHYINRSDSEIREKLLSI